MDDRKMMKGALFIGGSQAGKFGANNGPMLEFSSITAIQDGSIVTKKEIYFADSIQTTNAIFFFYRCEPMSREDAIEELFKTYNEVNVAVLRARKKYLRRTFENTNQTDPEKNF